MVKEKFVVIGCQIYNMRVKSETFSKKRHSNSNLDSFYGIQRNDRNPDRNLKSADSK